MCGLHLDPKNIAFLTCEEVLFPCFEKELVWLVHERGVKVIPLRLQECFVALMEHTWGT